MMLLGGLRYLLPVIEEAHKLGIHVITCDYLPDNIAHKYSDEYHNVSIIDKEAVLKLARELQIDGIMSFAVDPGVVTAAYVAEQMGLPNVGPYESVCILQDKAKFREFLRKNNFSCPWSYGYASVEAALADAGKYTYPAIVKPTDAAGSKGVTRVDDAQHLLSALELAMSHSIGGGIIVEEFIEKVGDTTGSDSFVVNGEIKFFSFDDQHFDSDAPNPYIPSAHSWPSSRAEEHLDELKKELQRLIALLNMKTGVFNIEARVGVNGKVYIMEVSPRGGGNRLSEVLNLATGVNLIENAVRACVGMNIEGVEQRPCQGAWAIMMLHSESSGIFSHIEFSSDFECHIVEIDVLVDSGDVVNAFRGANDAIGHIIVKYDTIEDCLGMVKNTSRHINVIVE